MSRRQQYFNEYSKGVPSYLNARLLGSRDFNVTYMNKRLFEAIDTENLEKGSGELINQLNKEEWKKWTELGEADKDGVRRFKNQQEILDYFSSHALMEGYFDEEAGINKQGTLVDIFVNKDNQVMFTLETRDDQGFKKLVPKTMRGTTRDNQVAAFSLDAEDGRTSFFDLGQLVATGHGAREIKFNQQIGGSLGLSSQIVASTKYGKSVDEARSMLPPSQGGTGLASGTRLDTQPGTTGTGTGDSSPADGGTVQDAISDLEDKIVSNEVPVPEAISIYDEKILPAIKNYNANIDKKIEDARPTESMRTSGGENTDALNIIQNLELDENGIPTKFLNQGDAETLFDSVKDTIVAAPNLPRNRDREPNPFSLKNIESEMKKNNGKWRNGEAALREIEEIENTPLEDIPDRNVGMAHTSKYTKMGGEIYIADGTTATGNKKYKKLSTHKAEQEKNVAMGKQGLADNIKAIQGAMGAERQTEINKANRLTQPKNERLERINDILDNEDVRARYTDSAIQDLEKEKATLIGEIMEINNQYISPDEAKRFGIDEKIPEGKDEFMEWAANENNEAKLKALGTDAETVDKAKEYIEKNNIENPEGIAAGPVWDPEVNISRTAVTAAIMASTGMTGNDYFNNFYKMSNFQATGDDTISQADVDKFNIQQDIKREEARNLALNKFLQKEQEKWDKEVSDWDKAYKDLIDNAFIVDKKGTYKEKSTIKNFSTNPKLKKEILNLTDTLNQFMAFNDDGSIDFTRTPRDVARKYDEVASLILDSVLQHTPNASGFVGRWRDLFRNDFASYGAMEQADHLVAETQVVNGQRRLVGLKIVQKGKETKAEIPREIFNEAFGPPGSVIRQMILSMTAKDMATLAEEQEDEG